MLPTQHKSVIAIPAAKRPELLALTLEKLSAALPHQSTPTSSPDVHIYADSIDETRLREIEIVRDLYLPEAFLFRAGKHVSAPSGCWNILNAIKNASRWAESVYLVEEDVLVYPYFFQWHQSQTSPASCGRRHPDKRWKYRHLYTNPGSCLRRPLLDALVPHINDEYFSDTRGYLDRTFGPWHEITHLDDGLIRNVMRANGWEAAYGKPVCAHIGFRGYAQLDLFQNNELDLEKRIERAREIMATTTADNPWSADFEPYAPREDASRGS
jgi:hypothetical protein